MVLQFSPLRRSRHPLARVLSLVLGLALLGLLLIFGLLAAGILLLGGGALLIWRHWTRGRHITGTGTKANPAHDTQPKVLEGEFVVLRREGPATH